MSTMTVDQFRELSNATKPKKKRDQPEQRLLIEVAAELRRQRLLFTHVVNEGKLPVQYRVKLKKMGVSPGVPDLLVFTAPASLPHQTPRVGLAMELKNGKKGRLSEHQETWLVRLELEGWRTCVCRDMDEVLALLRECYPGKTPTSANASTS